MTITHVREPSAGRPFSLFPTPFLAGFECSSHVDLSGERRDLLALTHHDRLYREDYERVHSVGIRTVRDGVHWHLSDECGRKYRFSHVEGRVAAARELGLSVIWDLFHYGYPDDLYPLHPSFVPRFGEYAYRFARWLRRRSDGPRFYVPVNEPSFFAWAGAEVGWFAPFIHGRGWDLKVVLAKAAIAGTEAIRAADPQARVLTADPVIHAVPPADEPDLAEDASIFNTYQYQFWDMLVGRLEPGLGGHPGYLDVVGVNYYPHNQWEHCRPGCLAQDDPRRKPFRQILLDVYHRYRRPIVVTETASQGDFRPHWLRMIVEECLAAVEQGVDLQGICLYPIVDMPEWEGGRLGDFLHYSLWDLVPGPEDLVPGPDGETLERELYTPYLEALRWGQRRTRASLREWADRGRRPAVLEAA